MLEKFSKNVLGEIFQFLDGRDIIRCERTSKKVSIAAKQDYLWRYLSENQLEIARKLYLDTWKECYWRSHNAIEHMTPKNFRHQMCPIRYFKNLIKFVDTYNNFIFACDDMGNVGVFLINERDLENDEETLKEMGFETEGVEFFKFIRNRQELFIVTKGARLLTYSICQRTVDTFQMDLKSEIILQDFNPSCLYVTQLDNSENLYFISNLPLSGEDFLADQSIYIFNQAEQAITFHQKLDFEDMSIDPFQNFHIQPIQYNPWGFRLQQNELLTIAQFKKNRQNYKLAAFANNKLIFSYFLKQLVVVETNLSKVELFMKKTNVFQQDIFPENAEVSINLLHYKGFLISQNISDLYLIDFVTLQVYHSLKIGYQISNILTFAPILSGKVEYYDISFIRHQRTGINLMKLRINTELKQIQEVSNIYIDEKHQINDIDTNRTLFCCATTEGNIKLRRLANPQADPFFINAGSKTIKTYIQHPEKPGVSIVKADGSKIIAVLGNIMRVYSFDIPTKQLPVR
eukprot:403372215